MLITELFSLVDYPTETTRQHAECDRLQTDKTMS